MELQAIIKWMMTASPVLVSYEESLLRPESSREEVINGELYIMPPATLPHARLIRLIQKKLDRSLGGRYDLTWETGFLFSESPLRYRIPDLAVVDVEECNRFLSERTETDPYARFAPVAVVEVLSPSNRKGNVAQLLTDYRDMGVREIVFVHPLRKLVTRNGETLAGNTLDVVGVTLTISDLFAD